MTNAITTPAPAGTAWDPSIPTTTHGGCWVYPGRLVLAIPGREWPHQPATCPQPYDAPGEWIGSGADEALVCTGCGLDIT